MISFDYLKKLYNIVVLYCLSSEWRAQPSGDEGRNDLTGDERRLVDNSWCFQNDEYKYQPAYVWLSVNIYFHLLIAYYLLWLIILSCIIVFR